MQHCNIILRTLGATLMALTLVLIPLSQAEATPCENLFPGESRSYCGSWCASIAIQDGATIEKLLHITITRSTDGYYPCTTNEVCGGGSCRSITDLTGPLIIEPEPKESAKPKKRRR